MISNPLNQTLNETERNNMPKKTPKKSDSLVSTEIVLKKQINPKKLTPSKLFRNPLIMAELARCYSDPAHQDGLNMTLPETANLFNLKPGSLRIFLSRNGIVKTPEMLRDAAHNSVRKFYSTSSEARLEFSDKLSDNSDSYHELIDAFAEGRIPTIRIPSWKHLCVIEGVEPETSEGYKLQEQFMMTPSALKAVLDVISLAKVPVLNEANINITSIESQQQISDRMNAHLNALKKAESKIELFDELPPRKSKILETTQNKDGIHVIDSEQLKGETPDNSSPDEAA